MLKRIRVQHLTLGMYVHQFCGSWMEHPFWRAGFVLKDPEDLARIIGTNVHEVWIDTARGADVARDVASTSREEADAQIDTDFASLAETPSHPMPPEPPMPPAPLARRRAPSSMQNELREAASICAQAKTAMASMFHEARMGRSVSTSGVQHLVEEISDSVTRNPSALISLARLKTADDYTYMHSVAVCAMMIALAQQIGMDDARTRTAGLAGLLHDIGKAAIPLSVLNKPGKLTEEEFSVVRAHPERGFHMLQAAGDVESAVMDACLHHHEKVDGTGYPHRLPAEKISLVARMAAICDVYDAITSDRPYKRGWDPAESLRRMAEWSRDHFDQRLFQAFVKSIGIYPVGSLVRLSSGRIGVVSAQNSGSLMTPTVTVFFSTKSGLRIPPERIDLAAPGCTEKIIAREDPDQWKFPDLEQLWSGMIRPK